MLWVGGVMAGKSRVMLRVLLVSAWIPCLVGILQWILVLRYGYQPAIEMFYGGAARHATQGYAGFTLGKGEIVRIPSTFSFIMQYYLYSLCSDQQSQNCGSLYRQGAGRLCIYWLGIYFD